MIKVLFLLVGLSVGFPKAYAEDLRCSLAVNGESAVVLEFSVEAGTKKMFIDSNDYRFFLINKGQSKFELEIYDAYSATRSYSAGYLRTNQDELSWTFWSREVLLETTCKLNQ